MWIYNQESIDSNCLTIKITKKETASSTSSCTGGSIITHTSEFRFSLAFTGWRAAWVGYREFENCPNAPARLPSCKYNQKEITMMEIQAPGVQGGGIYTGVGYTLRVTTHYMFKELLTSMHSDLLTR